MRTPAAAAAAAEAVVARQKVKQALAACRKATQRLSQAVDVDVYGQQTCAAGRDLDALTELVSLALSEHDQVDVVVLTTSPSQ